ncbi:MAG: FixH family protein [Bacteroidia bacterium]|nr:FixH family protein [Bacteroidia bacterium]
MKGFNWGHGITIFYIVFVLTLIMVLVMSTKIDHSLVVDDYYAKDLAYQQQYDKVANTINGDHLTIAYDRENQKVVFQFDTEKNIIGKIHFYRPSNKKLDFVKDIQDSSMTIRTDLMQVGRWKIKVDWTSGDKAFYKEEEIYI